MRWQPPRLIVTQNILRRWLRNITVIIAWTGASFLALGWWNFHRIVNQDANAKIAIFDLADEQTALINVIEPLILAYAALLCAVCANFEKHPPDKRAWVVLSGTFLVMSSLELGGRSHSSYIEFSSSVLGTNDIRLLLLPLLVFPIGAILFFTPFLVRRPRRHAVRFIACGAVFAIGALGMEVVSQSVAMDYGFQSTSYLVASGVEETLELSGVIGFCLAVNGYLRELSPELKFIQH